MRTYGPWIACGETGVHELTAGDDGHIRFMTCRGDPIEVVAAFDSKRYGTIIGAGPVEGHANAQPG